MTNNKSPAWIDDSEKYALIGLNVKIVKHLPTGNVAPNLWVLTDTAFDIPTHWQEWLGSTRTEEVSDCNLFLLSKHASAVPAVLDAENQELLKSVENFYVGLLLACTFAPAHKPIMLTGARRDGEVDIRQQHNFDTPVRNVIGGYPPVLAEHIHLAAELAQRLDILPSTPLPGGHWRLFRTLHIYAKTRTIRDILDRVHQFCRCVEGLIFPRPGETTRQFRSRTELFIGPRHHDLMGELYDVRSAVEHLHENRYLEGFDRETRLDLVRKEAIIENIARTSLARIIGHEALSAHFANAATLAAFWNLPPDERRRIWGNPIDPLEAIADFNPEHIHDGHLGAH